ncbi:ribonuclease H-like domain-containing protein [Tanacetum coccineum]
MASMIKTSKNARFCLKLKKLIAKHPDEEKLQSKKVKLESDVIENGNSFKPAAKTTTNADGTSTTLIPGLVTTEKKVQKKNDMKARILMKLILLISTANTQVSPASIQVSTASTQVSTANLSDATIYAFLASQPNGSQLVHEDLEQINEDELEEMNLKSDTAGYDKFKVECFYCHKMGQFTRECRGPRNQDSRNRNQDSSRRTVNVKETSSKAMVAIDGAGFDWSYMTDNEVPTNMALMDFQTLSELEKLKQEKESNQLKIEKFDNASKSLDKLIRSQITDKSRKGVGFVSYNAVPPPHTGLFSPPKLDLSYSGLEEFQQPEFEGYRPKTSKSVSEDISNKVRESPDAPLVEELVLDDKLEKKTVFSTVAKIEFVKPKQQEKPVRKSVKYVEMYRP